MIPVPEEQPLRDLFARVIDDTKAYVRAEVALVRTTVSVRVSQLVPAVGFIVGAILIVQAALTVLVAALGMLLARWLGTAGGLAAGAVIGLALAGLLVWLAIGRIKGVKP